MSQSDVSALSAQNRLKTPLKLLLPALKTGLKPPKTLLSAVPGIKRRRIIWEVISAHFGIKQQKEQKQAFKPPLGVREDGKRSHRLVMQDGNKDPRVGQRDPQKCRMCNPSGVQHMRYMSRRVACTSAGGRGAPTKESWEAYAPYCAGLLVPWVVYSPALLPAPRTVGRCYSLPGAGRSSHRLVMYSTAGYSRGCHRLVTSLPRS